MHKKSRNIWLVIVFYLYIRDNLILDFLILGFQLEKTFFPTGFLFFSSWVAFFTFAGNRQL